MVTAAVPIIETCFDQFRTVLGPHHDMYRNHVYRVYMTCVRMDPDQDHAELYAYAAFFHDVGIWTAGTIDYLQPSIAEACEYLSAHGKEELIGEITLMIYWHHKIRKYSGYKSQTVEVFRKADWADVSKGLIAFGTDRRWLSELRRAVPNLGFHRFLALRIIRNFFSHPLNPLPMFKR